jgi:hypothetical protein
MSPSNLLTEQPWFPRRPFGLSRGWILVIRLANSNCSESARSLPPMPSGLAPQARSALRQTTKTEWSHSGPHLFRHYNPTRRTDRKPPQTVAVHPVDLRRSRSTLGSCDLRQLRSNRPIRSIGIAQSCSRTHWTSLAPETLRIREPLLRRASANRPRCIADILVPIPPNLQ